MSVTKNKLNLSLGQKSWASKKNIKESKIDLCFSVTFLGRRMYDAKTYTCKRQVTPSKSSPKYRSPLYKVSPDCNIVRVYKSPTPIRYNEFEFSPPQKKQRNTSRFLFGTTEENNNDADIR